MTKLLRFLKLWPFHDLVIGMTMNNPRFVKELLADLKKWNAEHFVEPEIIWDFTDEEKEFLCWEQASDYDFWDNEDKSAQLDYIR